MSLQIVSLLATFGAYGLGRWLSRLCQLPSFGVTLDFDFVLVFAVNQPLILGLEHHIHPLFFALIAAPGINRLAVFLLSNFCFGKVLVAERGLQTVMRALHINGRLSDSPTFKWPQGWQRRPQWWLRPCPT